MKGLPKGGLFVYSTLIKDSLVLLGPGRLKFAPGNTRVFKILEMKKIVEALKISWKIIMAIMPLVCLTLFIIWSSVKPTPEATREQIFWGIMLILWWTNDKNEKS